MSGRILIVDDDQSMCELIEAFKPTRFSDILVHLRR